MEFSFILRFLGMPLAFYAIFIACSYEYHFYYKWMSWMPSFFVFAWLVFALNTVFLLQIWNTEEYWSIVCFLLLLSVIVLLTFCHYKEWCYSSALFLVFASWLIFALMTVLSSQTIFLVIAFISSLFVVASIVAPFAVEARLHESVMIIFLIGSFLLMSIATKYWLVEWEENSNTPSQTATVQQLSIPKAEKKSSDNENNVPDIMRIIRRSK